MGKTKERVNYTFLYCANRWGNISALRRSSQLQIAQCMRLKTRIRSLKLSLKDMQSEWRKRTVALHCEYN